jgi:fermentation-respiration switch protein FrsA (DUF1100 family)
MRSVLLKSRDVTLAGQLYLPSGFTEGERYPAIVVADPGGGREYAQRLSDQGFVTLLFDADGTGDSVRGAVDYLARLRFVNAERIGALVQAGEVAQADGRVKAVAPIPEGDVDGAMNQLTPFFMRQL